MKNKKVKVTYVYNGEPVKLSKERFSLFERVRPKAKIEVKTNK